MLRSLLGSDVDAKERQGKVVRDRHKELSRAAWQERERRQRSLNMRLGGSSWDDEQQAAWEAENREKLQDLEAEARHLCASQRLAWAWHQYVEWVADRREIKALRAK